MTKAFLVSTRKKNKLHKQFIAKRNPIQESWYKKYKNKLTHLIKNAKQHIMRKDLMQLKIIKTQLGGYSMKLLINECDPICCHHHLKK